MFKLLVAVLGGVLAVVIGTAILVQVIVIVVCVRKLRRAKGMVSHQKDVNTVYSTKKRLGTLRKEISVSSNYNSCLKFISTKVILYIFPRNEAYNYAVRQTGRITDEGTGDLYESV